MSRKRMVDALTQIYKETHQYETDTSAEFTTLPTPYRDNGEPRLPPGVSDQDGRVESTTE